MRAQLSILILLLCLPLGACSSSEQQAEELLGAAKVEFGAGRALEVNAPRPTGAPKAAFESDPPKRRLHRLNHYRKAISLSAEIANRFPDTLVAQGVLSGSLDLGGISLDELKNTQVPQLERRVNAEQDPLIAARLFVDQIKSSDTKADLLIAIARSFDVAGRGSEAKAALADAFPLAASLKDRSRQVQALCAIAVAHANASRKNESLEVAFSALSAAKQITDSEERAKALSQIALSYYLLGVEQRGYEALQSIGDKEKKYAALGEVSGALLEKNLPYQALAASTIIFDLEKRSRFLLQLAERASSKDLAAAALIFLEQALPLIAKIQAPQTQAELLLQAASLYRNSDRREQAVTLVGQAVDLVSTQDKSLESGSAKLLARAARELVNLSQNTTGLGLAQKVFEQTKNLPDEARAEALSSCCLAFAGADEPAKAYEAAKQIKNSFSRALVFAQMAPLTEAAGSHGFSKQFMTEAEALLTSISESESRSKLLLMLRDAFLEMKDFDQAQRIALDLKKEDKRWRTYLRSFQNQLFEKGFVDEALSLSRAAEDPYLRAVLLTEAAKARFRAESPNEAVALLEEATTAAEKGGDAARSLSLAALISDTMLQVKWPRLAESLVEKNKFSDKPVWYCRIAESYAATGQKQEAIAALIKALSMVLDLAHPEDRARVLMQVGETYAKLESPVEADASALLIKALEGIGPL